MLSFLLDEHISPKVAIQLKTKHPEIPVYDLQHWQQGIYLQKPDQVILDAATQQLLTLVTYDLRTIPTLLKHLSEQGQDHAGVIFVRPQTIQPDDIGGLVKALFCLWEKEHQQEWTNRIYFLSPKR